ncbi:MAG: ABC transporter ATP-binding protein [Alphaproteobacteria bacterium]|nr:ABC transporter ATP-binding protein [Alphaproteobacteria bacterium]
MNARSLRVGGLTKRFQLPSGDILAVDGVTFEVAEAEFFTMLGPSGCGKTTTLRMIAGLESPTSGTIVFAGQDYTRVDARHRNIGMVFQSYALFPHLPIFENVAYGLRVRGMAADDIQKRVTRILDLLGLGGLAERHPGGLSGGQQQRVSIARALVYEPGMLLLDEPLANLDAKLRVQMREEIRRIQRELGIMSLYVTHDQEEAMSVSDRIAVFNLGKLRQVGRAEEVYSTPATPFVADFIGKANFLEASPLGEGRFRLTNGTTVKPRLALGLPADEADVAGFDTVVMLRPERLRIDTAGGKVPCRILRRQFLGGIIRYSVEAEGAKLALTVDAPRDIAGTGEGAQAFLDFEERDAIAYASGR